MSSGRTAYENNPGGGGAAVPAGGAGDLVTLNGAGGYSSKPDYTDVAPTLAGSMLRGQLAPSVAFVEESYPNPASDRGFTSWTHDPDVNGSATAVASGLVVFSRLRIYQSLPTVNELHMWQLGAMSGAGTTTLVRYGLYRLAGNTATKFAQTGDLTASVGTIGDKGGALSQVSGRSMALVANAVDVYAAAIYVTTQATLATLLVGGGTAGAGATNAFLSLPVFKTATLAGQTDLPDTVDFTTVTTVGGIKFFGVK